MFPAVDPNKTHIYICMAWPFFFHMQIHLAFSITQSSIYVWSQSQLLEYKPQCYFREFHLLIAANCCFSLREFRLKCSLLFIPNTKPMFQWLDTNMNNVQRAAKINSLLLLFHLFRVNNVDMITNYIWVKGTMS